MSSQQCSIPTPSQTDHDDTTLSYATFLDTKRFIDPPSGHDIALDALPPLLFDWQRHLVRWALRRGRAGLFANTGLGKTLMQLAWAQQIPGRALIFAPLAVTHQTVREASKIALEVQYVRRPADMTAQVCITNYDLWPHFADMDNITGIVLDESSILKSLTAKTREALITHFTHIPYRLCCTATPAPNDIAEIANHAEFLGVMTRTAMLSTFFVHDDEGWRLRGHAREAFYRWLASWAMALRTPADLGYDASAFVLPPLTIVPHFLPTDWRRDGELFAGMGLHGITDRAQVRKRTVDARTAYAADLAREAPGAAVVWCGLNQESTAITAQLDGEAVCEITGSDSPEEKEQGLLAFLDSTARLLVTKASIAGYGLNLQHAQTAIFCGLSDSWEMWYQTVRRIWRYGQQHPVTVHVVLSEHERPIWENVQRKEQEALTMIDGLIDAMQTYEQEELHPAPATQISPIVTQYSGPQWQLYQGDCVDSLQQVPDNSVHLSIFSPPFLSLYQYSPTERDLGNCADEAEFFTHFGYVADQLMRVLVPGRLIAMHVSDVPAMQVRDGWIGLKNFSGHMIDHMSARGWLFHGKTILDKCPQAQAIRIRAKGLAFQQLHKDSVWMRSALPDYVLLFRKPGDNPTPIIPDIDNDTWIEWAHPVWYSTSRDPQRGISETHTLNAAEARASDDDRHICPLALDLIERCVRLYSNPQETVLDPFTGIGSTGHVAVQHDRQFLGCELKETYAKTAITNLNTALRAKNQLTLI